MRYELKRHLELEQKTALDTTLPRTQAWLFDAARSQIVSHFGRNAETAELWAESTDESANDVLDRVARAMIRSLLADSAAQIVPTPPHWWPRGTPFRLSAPSPAAPVGGRQAA